jgi:hypothetical protein
MTILFTNKTMGTSHCELAIYIKKFACPMTQKLLNLVKKWVTFWKIFDDGYVFDDGGDSTLSIHYFPSQFFFLIWKEIVFEKRN